MRLSFDLVRSANPNWGGAQNARVAAHCCVRANCVSCSILNSPATSFRGVSWIGPGTSLRDVVDAL